MKKSQIGLLIFSTILLFSTTIQAALTIQEYVPGETVVLDEATGRYWYRDFTAFNNMTYSQQITAIGNLGNYGGLSGWHVATRSEMEMLWTYSGDEIHPMFIPSEDDGTTVFVYGRYDELLIDNYHRTAYTLYVYNTGMVTQSPLGVTAHWDLTQNDQVGVWVTTTTNPIPAPSALIMSVIGVSSLMAARRRRRRQ